MTAFNKTESKILEFVHIFKYLSQSQLYLLFGKVNVGSRLIRQSATKLGKLNKLQLLILNRKRYYVANRLNLEYQVEHKLAIVKVAIHKYLQYQKQGVDIEIYIDSKIDGIRYIKPDICIIVGNQRYFYEIEVSTKTVYDINLKMTGYMKEGLLNEMRFVFLSELQKDRYISLINPQYMRQIKEIKYKLLSEFYDKTIPNSN